MEYMGVETSVVSDGQVYPAQRRPFWYGSGLVPANVNVPGTRHIRQPSRAESPPRGWYMRRGKRLLDVVCVALSLPVTVPVVALCALALWLEGGNPFYRQSRLGISGRRFHIYKLRTMVRDADVQLEKLLSENSELRDEWDATQKLKNDPRITRVGSLLRRTSLDELPQLLNVLRGEMSLVGPRPMMPQQLSLYDQPQTYFSLRPGLTGSWQVSDRNETGFEYRARFDASYAATLSFLEDVKLIGRTFGVVCRGTGY